MNLFPLLKPAYAIVCNSALKDCTSSTSPTVYVNNVIQGIFSVFMIVGVVYFIWHFIFAGLHMIGSDGDSKKLEIARNELLNSFVGLIAIFSVFVVLKLIGLVTGISGLQDLQIAWPTI